MNDDPWSTDIPQRYTPGQKISGKVTKITNFGVFVGLEDGLEGLLHISELADHKVENPEDVVKVGDELEVKVLRVDTEERKIGLSRRRVEWTPEEEAAEAKKEAGDSGSGSNIAQSELKGGLGGGNLLSDALKAAEEAKAAATPTEEAPVEEAPAEEAPAEPAAEAPVADEPVADEPAAETAATDENADAAPEKAAEEASKE